MAGLLQTTLGVGAAVALAGAGATVAGRVAFERGIAREVAVLFAGAAVATPTVVTEAQRAGLPAPVRR